MHAKRDYYRNAFNRYSTNMKRPGKLYKRDLKSQIRESRFPTRIQMNPRILEIRLWGLISVVLDDISP